MDHPPHIHQAEDEAFFLLDGALRVTCGDDKFEVEPGGFVYLPRGIPHSWSVVGDTPARFLTLLSPGGLEAFFSEVGVPATSLHPQPLTELPDMDRILFSPGGVEGFFFELGEAATSLHPQLPAGPPDMDRMLAVTAKYGVTPIFAASS